MATYNALGMDIFAGGFTVGVSKHFNVLAHLEEGPYGVKSFKLNYPNVPVVIGTDKWKPFIDDLKREHGKIHFQYANPPCAVWSVAGSVMRGGGDAWRKDPRISCWEDCFDAFLHARPHFYACESVTRAYTAGNEFMKKLEKKALNADYSVTHLLIDAQYLGVPQRRKRYFFIAHDRALEFQQPNWGPAETVFEVLSRVKDPGYVSTFKNDLQKKLLKNLPPKVPLRKLWEEEMTKTVGPEDTWPRESFGVVGRPRMFVHRVHGDQPIGAITGDYFIHPKEDRYLGMNELKVLNGFPEDYQFAGSPGAWASLIARGVCPPVGEWLARNVRNALDANKKTSGQVREVNLMEPPR